MTDPRIGDTVHYRSHGTPVREDGTRAYEPQCRAAIVTGSPDPNTLSLCILNPTGQFFDTHVPRDPANGWEDFNPGTWHHIH